MLWMLCGSTIVLVQTPREIVIAADSKTVSLDSSLDTYMCKIIQTGRYFFANSGFHGRSFDSDEVYDAAVSAASQASDIADCCFRFNRIIGPVLREVVASARYTDIAFYHRQIEGTGTLLSAAFCGLENKKLSVSESQTMVESDDNKKEGFRLTFRRRTLVNTERPRFLVFGSKGAIEEHLAINPGVWNLGLVAAAKKLIEIEIEREPNIVGPPIAILRIDKTGARWIQKTPYCKSIKK